MEKKKFVRKQERFVLFLMLLLLFPLGALAQQKLIKGQVVDEMGEPIIGEIRRASCRERVFRAV